MSSNNSLRTWLRTPRSRSWVLGGVALLLAVAWMWVPDRRSDAAQHQGKGDGAIAVDVAKVGRADVPMYLEGLGTIQAYNTVTVTARVDGELTKIAFREGQEVKKGELLAQIDPRPFQAALGTAVATKAKDEAQLLSAQADLERYIKLAPENLASKQTLDAQQATVAGLQATIKGDQSNIEHARTNLDYTSITSPIDGRTGIRRVDMGNNVHATDTTGIVVVTQLQPISLIFTLPEDALGVVNEALSSGKVQVSALSRDGAKALDQGTVSLVDNQIDQTTGTIRIKAEFPNTRNTLWPGQYVDARVLLRTDQGALTIPAPAVQRGPDGMFAYVVKADSTVEARPLKLGEESNNLFVVQSGIQEGERVVTSNQYRLQPGAHVKISHEQAAAPAVADAKADRLAGPASK